MPSSEKRIPKDIDKDIDSPQGFDNDNSTLISSILGWLLHVISRGTLFQ